MRADGFPRWMRRMDSRASASAAAVTVQVLSTTIAALDSESESVWPEASRFSRIASASACVARQPKLRMKKVDMDECHNHFTRGARNANAQTWFVARDA